MPQLLIATGNPGKLREFRALFDALEDGADWELISPAGAGISGFEVVEDGGSYAANAGRKARAYANAAGLPALADDSGLEVDALDGAPGIYSARYAGEGADDAANRRKLLDALDGAPAEARTARYRAVVALAFPYATNVRRGEGAVEGRIAMDERGGGGFGYDPLFELPDGRRMAELALAEKNAISHRARALGDARWALDAIKRAIG